MASYLSFMALLIFTFLLASTPLTSARDLPASDITLEQDLKESYYIVKRKPVVLVCRARNAADITFTCAGTQIPPTSIEEEDLYDVDPTLIQAKIEVTRADIQNSNGENPFWCECSALDVDGQVAVTSRRGFISIPHMRHRFHAEPQSKTASEGENVEFMCKPPKADPKPQILWRKNRKRLNIESNSRLVVTDTGSLVIESVTAEDAGMYQCVAKNPAGRRESNEAQLTISVLAESAEPEMEISQQVGVEGASEGKLRKPRQSKTTLSYFTTEPEKTYYVTENDVLNIDCGATGADIVTFRCNGERMDKERISSNQGQDNDGNRMIQSQLSLTYSDVEQYIDRYADKIYQCQCIAWYQDPSRPGRWAHLSTGEETGKVFLAFIEDQFKKEPRNVVAGVNTDATIKCEAPKGQPSPWIYWYKDRTRLDPRSNDKYSINAKGHLIIKNAQYSDAGYYNCLAENIAGSKQSPMAQLTITAEPPPTTTPAASPAGGAGEEYVPEFPAVIPSSATFLRDLKPETALGPDGTATLLCAAVSVDQMTIDCGQQRLQREEYEQDTKIDPESGKRLISVKATVTADQLADNPDDFYCMCTAWYLEGRDWAQTASTKGYVVASSGPYIEDEFVFPPESIEAGVGEDAELACEPPKGNPEPQVYWLKDGERISSNDPNYVVMEEGPLYIEFVDVDDEGMYTCVAENEAGRRASNPVQLTVVGQQTQMPESTSTRQPARRTTTTPATTTEYYDYDSTSFRLDEPMFTLEPNPFNYVTKDNPVTLNCTVVAAKRLVFACNDREIQESASTGYITTDQQNQLEIRNNYLTITRDQVENHQGADAYFCTCRGFFQPDGIEPGEWVYVESERAYIESAYLRSRFEKEPMDKEVEEYDSVSLQCKAPNGVPAPTISWLKNGLPVDESEMIRVEDDGSLVIESFEAQDEGEYSCVATNIAKERISQSAMVRLAGGAKPEPSPEPESKTTDSWGTGGTGGIGDNDIPYISKDLHSTYYLIKNKPVTISCEAYSVKYITFSCGMKNVEVEKKTQRIDNGMMVIMASIDIRKQDLENHNQGEEYWCQCYAHYDVPGMADEQILSSNKGYVETGYLKKNFLKEPENQRVNEGEFLSINCGAPMGNPKPVVSWTKDGEKVDALSITPDGALIFSEARPENTGEYVCMAENVAGVRSSPPILVEVIEGDSPAGGGAVTDPAVVGEGIIDSGTDGEDGIETDKVVLEGVDSEIEGEGAEKENTDMESDTNEDLGTETDGMDGKDNEGENGETEEDVLGGDLEVKGEDSEGVDMEEEGDLLGGGGNEGEGRDDIKTGAGIVDGGFDIGEGGESERESEGESREGGSEDNFEVESDLVDESGRRQEQDLSVMGGVGEATRDKDGKKKKNKSGKGNKKGKKCPSMVTECTRILPVNVPDDEYCKAQDDFYACVDNVVKKCTGITNKESLEAFAMTKMHVKNRCSMVSQCPKLAECKMAFSNTPDNSMDTMGLPIREFCGDVRTFIRCVDQRLAECNVTMLPPEEGVRGDLFDVTNWFTQYCNRLVLGSGGLDTCNEMTNCDLHIGQGAPDNATYWCRLVDSMVECTVGAVNTCGLDELRNDLEYLHSQSRQFSCSEDTWSESKPEPEGGVDPETGVEAEGGPEIEGGVDPEGEPGQGKGEGDGDGPGAIGGKKTKDSRGENVIYEDVTNIYENTQKVLDANFEGDDNAEETDNDEEESEEDSDESSEEDFNSSSEEYDSEGNDSEDVSEDQEDEDDQDDEDKEEELDLGNSDEEQKKMYYDYNREKQEFDQDSYNEKTDDEDLNKGVQERKESYDFESKEETKIYYSNPGEEVIGSEEYTDGEEEDGYSHNEGNGEQQVEAPTGEASSKDDDENGSSMVGSSVLLATISQLVLMAILSRR